MYHIFIHSSVGGHLGSFHVLAVVYSTTVNMTCIYLFKLEFSSLSDTCPGMRLQNHKVALFVVF